MAIPYRFKPGFFSAFISFMFIFLLVFSGSVSSGETTLTGTVSDISTNEPIANATVTVNYSDNGTIAATSKTDSTGHYEISGLLADIYIVRIEADGYINKSIKVNIKDDIFGELDTYELNAYLVLIPQEDEVEPPVEYNLFYALFLSFILIIIATVTSLVMYSKIKRENLLKNAIRKRIFEYITENPGTHYRGILNDLGLPMGVLSYHLNRLEKANYIKSRQDGMYRRFYVRGRKTEVRFILSDIQEAILAVIRENRGISQSKIAEKISSSRKVVNYHVNILDQAGLILVESHGRESACYPVDPKIWET